MKILIVHNFYKQPGGEDIAFQAECELLQAAGHHVVTYIRKNDEIKSNGFAAKLSLGVRTLWACDSAREVLELLLREQPDLAHFHNTFPLISPAVYDACQEARVPVVQTLHNYRLLCPAADFFRDGAVCRECAEDSLWRGVQHACYRNSRAATGIVALMLKAHRWRQTWTQMVDCYIVQTRFARARFMESGIPQEKLFVKPNFVQPDPGYREDKERYALFAGRLSDEKGVRTLFRAWEQLRNEIPLVIIGDGPLHVELQAEACKQRLRSISFRGRLPRAVTCAAIKEATLLVFPSECYESCPMGIIEAFACGTPVICTRLGAMQEIVDHGRTGLHFAPGDPAELAETIEWGWTHPRRLIDMGREARAEYEAQYTAEQNYCELMQIYEQAISLRKAA